MTLASLLGHRVAVHCNTRVATSFSCSSSSSVSRLHLQSPFLHTTRLLSSSKHQNTRLIPPSAFRAPQTARNYWWSSTPTAVTPDTLSSPLPIQETSPIPEQPVVTSNTHNAETTNPPITPSPISPATESTGQTLDTVNDATTSSLSVTEPFIASEPVISEELVSNIVPPPLHYGDLSELGLVSMSPAGIFRWTLEFVNVTTGLPWFWTIVAVTFLVRVMMAPLTVQSLRNAELLKPIAPKIAELRPQMEAARAGQDTLALQRIVLKQRALYEEQGINMTSMILTPFLQIPVMMGIFFGVKTLCEYPLEQLKHSGVEFWQDLTVADPTYVLPLITAILMNVQIKVGMRDMDLTTRPGLGHVMNTLRVFSVFSVYFLSNFPAGVALTVTSGIATVLLQTFILRIPFIRHKLRIPPILPTTLKPPSLLDTLHYARRWVRDITINVSSQKVQNSEKLKRNRRIR